MSQGIDLKTAAYRYAKNSIRTFVEGGKYARDKKPRSIAWLLGVVGESGVSRDDLVRIFSELSTYPMDAEGRIRFEEGKRKIEEMIERRTR